MLLLPFWPTIQVVTTSLKPSMYSSEHTGLLTKLGLFTVEMMNGGYWHPPCSLYLQGKMWLEATSTPLSHAAKSNYG